jgi:putative DNA primase/helicase
MVTIGDNKEPSRRYGLTEAYQAERLAAAYLHELKYDHDRRGWFVYRDHLWRADRVNEVHGFAVECGRSLYLECEDITDEKARRKAQQFAKFCQSQPGITRVLAIAATLECFRITAAQWNTDPWIVGTPNGILDLRAPDLRDGQPDDLISLSLGVPYDPDAECPRWETFVREIFNADEELVAYLQRVLGYTLSGITREQVWFLLDGAGANGKSTLLNVIGYVLGDYAKVVPFSMFDFHQRNGIPDDIATLVDRRYVSASETIEGSRLNESRIKMLTGGEPITARPLYGKWFTFDPRLKLFLGCNHKPKVIDDSHGFWRRVHVIPFHRKFEGAERDPNLFEALKAEGPGILNWIVNGCLMWQMEGLAPPRTVLAATSEYEVESNPLNEFIAVCCEENTSASVSASVLFAAYESWSKNDKRQDVPLNLKAFGDWMSKRYRKQHTRLGNVYHGVRLRA